MGNCCGKEEGEGGGGGRVLGGGGGGGNFKGQGRTLGDAAPRQAAAPKSTTETAPVPATVSSNAARPLGGGGLGVDDEHRMGLAQDNPRSAAAAAAEARASKPVGADKLSRDLAAQKKAGMKGALEQGAEENRRHREIDAAAQARNHS